ncbi:MAG: CARDB domain-containing protein [Crocosphaera sp.]
MKADLLGRIFDVRSEPLTTGDDFTVRFQVDNIGGTTTEPFLVDFYLSADDEITTDDEFLDYYEIYGLGADSDTGYIEVDLFLPSGSDSFWGPSGNYYIGMIVDAENDVDESNESNNFNRAELGDYDKVNITVIGGLSDLTPFKPRDWDDKIVVSIASGTNRDAPEITSNDAIYVDWAYINQGDAATSNIINTRLLLNGSVVDTWTRTNPLEPNFYTWVEDIEIDPLNAGTYVLDLEVDYLDAETEEIETNNFYDRTFTVINVEKSDLTPYKPSEWDDKIVVSIAPGTNRDAPEITSNDTIYVDGAYINQGDIATSNIINTRLLLNGEVVYSGVWSSPLQPNWYIYNEDIEIEPLAAGNYTLELEVDYLNQETEKSESNNVYSRSFTVESAAQSDLTPYQPTGWSNKIVVSTVEGTNIDASQITSSDTIYVDWAYINQGEIATSNSYTTRLLLNGDVVETWRRTSPLDPDFYTWIDDIEINPLTAGNHTLRLEVDYLNEETETIETNNVFERNFTVESDSVNVDLTPYKPRHWDGEIVVSTVEDTYTDSTVITDKDTLYIDWAYANFGEGDTQNSITTRLLIDGELIDTSQRTNPLLSNYYTWLEDIEIQPLTVGYHTIRLEVDFGNNETETDESNNFFEKTITVIGSAQSDLTPYQPQDWDGEIVISTIKGNHKNANQITTEDTLYIDWAYLNEGEAATSNNFSTRLLLDGVEIETWDRTRSLLSNYYSYVTDFEINDLSVGNHTLRLEVDYENEESESNDNNNVFETTFTVVSGNNQPDLTPFKPDDWGDKLVISTTTGTNTNSNQLTTDDTIYVDWSYINQGNAASNVSHKTRLLLDGVEIDSWTRDTPIDPNTYLFLEDINLGQLTAGTHKLTLEVDYDNQQGESNENNNIFEKTFTVQLTNPGTVPSTGNPAFDLIDIDRLRSDPLYSDIDGSNLSVVVVDTGLWGSHTDLRDNFKAFVDVSGNNFTETTNPSLSFDKDSHGTHVAGTIGSSNPEIGVAPDVGLIGINFLDNFGQNTFNNTFDWILDNKDKYNIVAVNMSLGNADPTFYQSETEAAQRQRYWQNVIQKLEQANITVVATAGNNYFVEQKPGTGAPGIFSTLNVGGVWQQNDGGPWRWRSGAIDYSTDSDHLMAMSQRLDIQGTYDDTIFAPGAYINSTVPNNKYGGKAGTSMAAPHVAGVVALMQEAAIKFGGKLLEPNTIAQIIHDTADTIFDGDDQEDNVINTNTNYRRINAYNAVEAVRNLFDGLKSNFTPLGAFGDTNGTFDGANVGTILNGNEPVTLVGSLGTDGINTAIGNTDVDLYEFEVESPGTITIELIASSQSSQFVPLSDSFQALSDDTPNLQDVDTVLRLFDENKQEIAFDDDSGEGGFSKLVQTLAEGTYFVGVSGQGNRNYDPDVADSGTPGATGNYAISFSLTNDDVNGTIVGATDVNFGNYNAPYTITEVIGIDNGDTVNLSDVDLFKVIIPDNGQLLVDIDTPFDENFANTYLRIFDEEGKEVFSNDDGLFVSDVLQESNETTDANQPGLVFEDTTFVGHETDSFLSGAVKRGEIYYIGVSNHNHNSYDPNTLENRPQGGEDDQYNLTIQFVNNDLNGSITQARSDLPLPVKNVPGFIGQDAVRINGVDSFKPVGDRDVDFVKINSETAGILQIEAISSTVDPVNLITSIFDTEGALLATDDTPDEDGNSLLQYEIEAQTDYFVAITGLGNNNFDPFLLGSGTDGDTGEYTFSSSILPITQFVPLSDDGLNNGKVQTVTIGEIVAGNIGVDEGFAIGADDIDIYRFVAPETRKIDIRTFTNEALSSSDTFLRFFDAQGNEIASNDDANENTTGSLITVDVIANTQYYIGVSGFSEQAGNYNPLTGEGAVEGSQGTYQLLVDYSLANTAPSKLSFNPDQESYNFNEQLQLTNSWLYDEDGSSDLAKVDFWVKTPSEEWIDISDINSFTPWPDDNKWGSFTYTLDLEQFRDKGVGTYTIWGQAEDSSGAKSNVISRNFELTQVNTAPEGLQFNVSVEGNILNLTNAWIYDYDGYQDLSNVDLWLKKEGENWQDIEDITNFTPWQNDNDWASINHKVDLSTHSSGSYMIWAKGYDQEGLGSNYVTKTFDFSPVNIAPEGLQFKTNKQNYNPTETLVLEDAWVYDEDGYSDVVSVDFWVKNTTGKWIDVSDADSFSPWSNNNDWVSFEYSLNLTELQGSGVGGHTLWGQATDKNGATSNVVTKTFTMDNMAPSPTGLEGYFDIDAQVYTSNDTLHINNGWVRDLNGVGDIKLIDFWLKKEGEAWRDIEDISSKEITPWSQDTTWGSFDYSLDLTGLTTGSYTLWSGVQDQTLADNGTWDNIVQNTFAIQII